ncbi:MAG: hypothetical protein LIO74_05000 [Ruminococcus sp.]|nr:hypothetical protein [Ruminococcus sp.]
MNKNQNNHIHFFPLRLLFCLLLTFTLLGSVLCGTAVYLVQSPSLLLSQIEKQDAAQKTYESLSQKFNTQYNTTAVPPEVYLDVITISWIDDTMTQWIKCAYNDPKSSPSPEYSTLEDAINTYFEDFAEENNYEKDETYVNKLSEITENAESTIITACDIYQIQTMQSAGIWNKIMTHQTLFVITFIVCLILSIGLLLMLFFLQQNVSYWMGCSFFASGILLTVPMIVVLCTKVIKRFVLKEAATYAVFTGTMTYLAKFILICGACLSIIGLLLLCIGIISWKRKSSVIPKRNKQHEKY